MRFRYLRLLGLAGAVASLAAAEPRPHRTVSVPSGTISPAVPGQEGPTTADPRTDIETTLRAAGLGEEMVGESLGYLDSFVDNYVSMLAEGDPLVTAPREVMVDFEPSPALLARMREAGVASPFDLPPRDLVFDQKPGAFLRGLGLRDQTVDSVLARLAAWVDDAVDEVP